MTVIVSQPFALTSATSVGLVAPQIAQDAGYTNLAFSDDFTSDTISYKDGSGFTGTGNPKWFVEANANTRSNTFIANGVLNFVQSPNTSGAQAQLGSSGGDYQHSTAAFSTPGAISVGNATGLTFAYGYFEASIAFPPSGGGGFPAFWTTNTYSNGVVNPHMELDFMESGVGTYLSATVWEWFAGGNHNQSQDSGFNNSTQVTPPPGYAQGTGVFNTYSCLWQPNKVTFYITPHGSTIPVQSVEPNGRNPTPTGPGTSFPSSNLPFQPGVLGGGVILGTGSTWDMTVDWVRVWQ